MTSPHVAQTAGRSRADRAERHSRPVQEAGGGPHSAVGAHSSAVWAPPPPDRTPRTGVRSPPGPRLPSTRSACWGGCRLAGRRAGRHPAQGGPARGAGRGPPDPRQAKPIDVVRSESAQPGHRRRPAVDPARPRPHTRRPHLGRQRPRPDVRRPAAARRTRRRPRRARAHVRRRVRPVHRRDLPGRHGDRRGAVLVAARVVPGAGAAALSPAAMSLRPTALTSTQLGSGGASRSWSMANSAAPARVWTPILR
jgi:hypothetical protein